jgi:hypothetical protein
MGCSGMGASSNNRTTRFYALMLAGRKQITSETKQWERVAAAVGRVLTAEYTVQPGGSDVVSQT